MASIDPQEIENFAAHSSRWWEEDGPFKPLHKLNPIRLAYIKDQLCDAYERDTQSLTPLKGLKIVDIGCGGGLVCEPLARLGADVTGLDADENAINIAREHAKGHGLKVNYQAQTAENHAHNKAESYDAVLALEIVEHVTDPAAFVQSCAALCKPGGLVILSTLNRTARSFMVGIIAAEHILRWVPGGTHEWKKFIKPSELAAFMRSAGLAPRDMAGYTFNPLTGSFELADQKVGVNYLMTGYKS